jgi:predicted nucleic acid-binding protein
MPEVIANTSPIQYLFQLDLLDLLPHLYGHITIPHAVSEEIDRGRMMGVDLPDLSTLSWARLAAPHNLVLFPLTNGLGRGELQVIAIAKEVPDHLALLDDRRARRFADLLGIRYTGPLGLLIKAKQAGYLDRLAPVCDRLVECGFRLRPETRHAVLTMTGE